MHVYQLRASCLTGYEVNFNSILGNNYLKPWLNDQTFFSNIALKEHVFYCLATSLNPACKWVSMFDLDQLFSNISQHFALWPPLPTGL